MIFDIKDLTHCYQPGIPALNNLSLEIPEGQFIVLLGLSGSGKSTLIRCLNGLVKPTHGTVKYRQQVISNLSEAALRPLRKQMGMIWQQFNLVPNLSVLANVAAGALGELSLYRSLFWPAVVKARALELLGQMGLADMAGRAAGRLSGGQQQRVAIARALMQNPQLILADEPVASLDPTTSNLVMETLTELNKKQGLTVICSLHQIEPARRHANRLVALKAGQIVFDGPPEELTEQKYFDIYREAQ